MKSSLPLRLSMAFWAIVIIGYLAAGGSIVESLMEVNPSLSAQLINLSVMAAIGVGIVLNFVLLDQLGGSADVNLHDEQIPLEKRQKAARMQSKKLLASKQYKLAVVALQQTQLHSEALEIARQFHDEGLAAKIFMDIGNKRQAKTHYFRAGKYKEAGNTSVLLGLIEESRDFYSKYADQLKLQKPGPELADMLDRCWRFSEAITIYEEIAEYERAAESARVIGDEAHALKMEERIEVKRALEKSGQSGQGVRPSRQSLYNAESAVKEGDYFHAAWLYRVNKEWQQAAGLYEFIGEWYRAGLCYERAGEKSKAEAFFKKAQQERPVDQSKLQEETKPSQQLAPPPAPAVPSPGNADQMPAATGHHAAGSLAPPPPLPAPTSLPAPQIFQPVYTRAVATPLISGSETLAQNRDQWRKDVRAMALEGHLAQAANLMMQLGEMDEAVQYLSDAGDVRRAALLAISAGNYPKAADLLVQELDQADDPELGMLLAEILLRLDDPMMAIRLFRSKVTPEIRKENSETVYRFGRMLEKFGFPKYAAEIYEEIIESGGQSEELQQRIKAVRKLIGDPRADETTAGRKPKTDILTSGFHEKLGPQDFLDSILDDEEMKVSKPAPEKPKAKPVKPFPFTPKNMTKEVPKLETQQTAPLPEPAEQLSLLMTEPNPEATGDENPFSLEKRYEFKKELGRGGMGTVYRAEDTLLGRPVALKLLNSFGADTSAIQQFIQEARAIAMLDHQNIIRVYDMGMMNLQHYIAMEYVEGLDLTKSIQEKKRLSVKEALKFFVEIASGLKAAHDEGVVHRDIKPSNVLIAGNDAGLRIVDFGLAKLHKTTEGEEENEETIYRSAGTPGYMAPEQIRGEEVGPSADIYALGITLFTMLVGNAPHQALKIRGMEKILQFQLKENLPAISRFRKDIPAPVDQIFQYCTSTQVKDRYQEIDQFLDIARQWAEVV